MTGQTVTQVVNKTRLYPPVQNKTVSSSLDQGRYHDNLVRHHGNKDKIPPEDKVTLCDALKSDARETLPPICWDDAYWRESTVISAGKATAKVDVVKVKTVPQYPDLLNLYTAKSTKHQQPISFRELTAEFDRMLKPLSQQFAGNSTQTSNDEWYYDTSGDCEHPVLAVEPRNPATPPSSFKIHKQRMVIKPGYTYMEPVLLDVPLSPECSEQGLENLLDIAEKMKPVPPRIDNFTHYPPSRHLHKPCYYSPRLLKPSPKQNHHSLNRFNSHSKCSTSSIEM